MRRSICLTCALVAGLTGTLLSPAAGAGSTLNHVQASMTWKPHDRIYARQIRLTITRNGAVALHAASVAQGGAWRVVRERHAAPVHVVDLTGGQEPNVLVDLSSGGAGCCNVTRIYRWNGHAYARSPLYELGEGGYTLRKLAHDGSTELVGALSTAVALGTADADSGSPLQVWRQTGASLRTVTRRYPALLRRDAATWHALQAKQHASGAVSAGSLAAYAADLERLGQPAKADAAIDAAAADGELKPFTAAHVRGAIVKLLRALDAKHPPVF
jgi:hypothetical protein